MSSIFAKTLDKAPQFAPEDDTMVSILLAAGEDAGITAALGYMRQSVHKETKLCRKEYILFKAVYG